MTELSAQDFQKVYEDLGIDIPKLGCIMLDVPALPVVELLGDDAESMLYTSENKERFWIKGAVGAKTAHVTLQYGLMESGVKWKKHVNTVLDGWELPMVTIDKISFFPSPFADENYSCIVGLVSVTDELMEGHHRLQMLPHIDTNPGYKPHVTLAYVNTADTNKAIMALRPLRGMPLEPVALNYGKNHS